MLSLQHRDQTSAGGGALPLVSVGVPAPQSLGRRKFAFLVFFFLNSMPVAGSGCRSPWHPVQGHVGDKKKIQRTSFLQT